jgi:hypothetical protein
MPVPTVFPVAHADVATSPLFSWRRSTHSLYPRVFSWESAQLFDVQAAVGRVYSREDWQVNIRLERDRPEKFSHKIQAADYPKEEPVGQLVGKNWRRKS